MVFGLFTKGKKLANAVADQVGIKRDLFDTALLEMGVSWMTWKSFEDSALTPRMLADEIRPQVVQGLNVLKQKFGDLDEITKAINKVSQDDLMMDIEAMKIAKEKMLVEPVLAETDRDGSPRSAVEAQRDAAFSDWIEFRQIPGGMDAARVLSCVWANVAERAQTVPDIAYMVNIPLERTEIACRSLKVTGTMVFGTGRDGQEYLKLNDVGMSAGKQISRQWMSITRLYPLP
ncbi:hypothetical protein ASD04_07175 [Devosia sp. Root436]|uniref:hypothetical protein n=1 Tax=Devosia sp. Root436 TaxID=1736537 RepID=UPI0006F1F412|nr:hypothetical protein [Devosia sp. Root436]KQX40400.1 hypothetical protein ASD04_07175 [Devosia sp. Root436]